MAEVLGLAGAGLSTACSCAVSASVLIWSKAADIGKSLAVRKRRLCGVTVVRHLDQSPNAAAWASASAANRSSRARATSAVTSVRPRP